MKVATQVYAGIENRRRKVVFDLIFSSLVNKEITGTWLDVGCATGDFLFFASSEFPECFFEGLDVSPELISIARDGNNCDRISFRTKDFFNGESGKYDVVSALAVSGYFNDEAEFLLPLMNATSNTGRLFIHGLFNPYGLTVDVRWKSKGEWQAGLSQLSLDKTLSLLRSEGFKVNWKKVVISDRIAFDENYPHRAFTSPNDSDQLMNGCMMLLPDYLLECTR